ncbi:TniQ protein [Bacillus sp. 349Y]|nr:TniQ protein [Bacillus sp. 349Y]
MGRLLQVPNPQIGESLKSFLSRISMANHYDYISWMYELCNFKNGKSLYRLTPRENDLNDLSNLVGIPCEKLWGMTFVNEFKDRLSKDYYTQLIYKTGLVYKHSKVCPCCINEDKYEHKMWDLKINLACYKHEILLINECSKCHNFISSRRINVEYCICGFPLVNLPKVHANKALIEIAKLLQHSLNMNSNKDETCNPFYELSLNNQVSLLTFFSKQLTLYLDYEKFTNCISTTNKDFQQIIIDAFEIFENWPNNFHSFLNKFRSTRIEKRGARLQLSGIYIGLHRKFTQPEFSFLRDEYYKSINKDKNRNHKIVRSKISLIEESNFLNSNEVTKLLKLKPSTVKKLIVNGVLEGDYKDFSGHEQLLVPKESINKYHALIKNNLRLTEVAAIFDIGVRKVVELQSEGLINALLGPHLGIKQWLFAKDSVDSLLSNLLSTGKIEDDKLGETINFTQASRIASFYNLKIGDFINLLLKKEIIPYLIQTQNNGLNQIMFNKKDIEKTIKFYNERTGCVFNALEISRILGVCVEYVRFWIKAGLIKSNKVNQVKKVHINDLSNFQKKYISLKSLSTKLIIHSTKLRRLLLEQNIYPVIGNELIGGYLYLVNDVKEYLTCNNAHS